MTSPGNVLLSYYVCPELLMSFALGHHQLGVWMVFTHSGRYTISQHQPSVTSAQGSDWAKWTSLLVHLRPSTLPS